MFVVRLISLVVLLGLHSQGFAAELMTYEQYKAHSHPTPVVLRYEADEGALLIVGVQHTSDADDPQIKQIQKLWRKFKPTVAYFEGDGWNIGNSTQDTISRFGEPGLVRLLASSSRVPVAALEPDFANEIGALKSQWSDEQIKLFYTLRPVAAGVNPMADDQIQNYLSAGFPTNPGVRGPPETLAELASSAAKQLGLKSWRDAPADWFDPTATGHFTNDIARASGAYRDQYMFQVLSARVKAGDRVFAVVGATHAVMQEPLFSSTFKLVR